MLETTGRKHTDRCCDCGAEGATQHHYCRPCSSRRNAFHNGRSNAISRIAADLVGGIKALYAMSKDARLAVRRHATELYDTGQDWSRSETRLQQTKDGFVYIISNPAWSALKIGMAVEPHGRLKGYQTSSPNRDYKLEDYVYVDDRRKAEAEIHDWLGTRRLEGEWFNVPLGEARMVLSLIRDFYCPEQHQSENTTNVAVRSSEQDHAQTGR